VVPVLPVALVPKIVLVMMRIITTTIIVCQMGEMYFKCDPHMVIIMKNMSKVPLSAMCSNNTPPAPILAGPIINDV
jgi:hypothetical protein